MSTALTALTKLVNPDTIPAMLALVVELLSHPMDIVRKKAVMALHRFYQKAPQVVSHLLPRFRQALCDKARQRPEHKAEQAPRSRRCRRPGAGSVGLSLDGVRGQDPSVMAASLCALHDLVALDAAPFRNLAPSLVSILTQARPAPPARPPAAAAATGGPRG